MRNAVHTPGTHKKHGLGVFFSEFFGMFETVVICRDLVVHRFIDKSTSSVTGCAVCKKRNILAGSLSYCLRYLAYRNVVFMKGAWLEGLNWCRPFHSPNGRQFVCRKDCARDCQWFIRMMGSHINTFRPRQDGRHFADDIFTCILFKENCCILIKFSLKYVRKGPIDNNPALAQIMAWRRSGDKPLSEPMVVSLLTHICVTRPQ